MSEQLRVQIAEWCGWTIEVTDVLYAVSPDGQTWQPGLSNGLEYAADRAGIPDFTGDLNAIASAEAKLSDEQWPVYLNRLSQATGACRLPRGWQRRRELTRATALQRATALARVINQERE